MPSRVVVEDGTVLFEGQDVRDGQNVWQIVGGQQLGSVWGHGAYVAPDWSADWLHREATVLLDAWAQRDHGAEYATLDDEKKAVLGVRLRRELRTNTYDSATGQITVSADGAAAIREVGEHYEASRSPHSWTERIDHPGAASHTFGNSSSSITLDTTNVSDP